MTITVVSPSFLCSSRISTRTSWRSLASRLDERFVEQEHVGPEDERARQRHALLLAARQLARQALGPGAPAGPAAAHRRRGALVSAASTLRISRPKATFCATRQVRKKRIALKHQPGVALPGR